MFGPSGFFQDMDEAGVQPSSADLEIIHDSEAGISVLYKGCKNGRFFVYKALKPQFRGNPLYEEVLKKDFNLGFSLIHPNICQYYGMVSMPSLGNCIVMDWIDGCSLATLLAGGKIDRKLSEKIICELCDALEYMHRKQIVHRDLKPENILITHNGWNVKLIDFGFSDADSYNVLKAPAGTRIYASPELLAGEQIDGRSGIWSLGMVIGEISQYYGNVAERCLRRDREKRFRTAAEVKEAVLKTGRRKFIMSVCWLIALVLVSAGIWLAVRNIDFSESEQDLPEAVLNENTVSEQQDTVLNVAGNTPAARENPSSDSVSEPEEQPERQPEDSIDSATLEDLFKEAAEHIL